MSKAETIAEAAQSIPSAPLIEIGFWADPRDPEDPRPLPARLVDEEWALSTEAHAVALYLHSGFLESYELGYSFCRFGCGDRGHSRGDGFTWFGRKVRATGRLPDKFMGCCTLTDGKYAWPEGFAHYVSTHAVRPPEEFLTHVRGNLRALRQSQAGGRLRWDIGDDGVGRTVNLDPGTAVFLRDRTTLGIALSPEPELEHRRGSSPSGVRMCAAS